MHHVIAIVASLLSLGLIAAIYYCNILARPTSWLRDDTLTASMLALFTGLLPIGMASTGILAWSLISEPVVLGSLVTAGVDLVSLAALIATLVVFRALMLATRRRLATPQPERQAAA